MSRNDFTDAFAYWAAGARAMKTNHEIRYVELFYHGESQKGYPTQGAILVSEFGVKESAVWLPKSQIEFFTKPGPAGYTIAHIDAPEWLLDEKGLI